MKPRSKVIYRHLSRIQAHLNFSIMNITMCTTTAASAYTTCWTHTVCTKFCRWCMCVCVRACVRVITHLKHFIRFQKMRENRQTFDVQWRHITDPNYSLSVSSLYWQNRPVASNVGLVRPIYIIHRVYIRPYCVNGWT